MWDVYSGQKIETSKVINLLKLSYKFDASACYVDLKKVGAQKCKKVPSIILGL